MLGPTVRAGGVSPTALAVSVSYPISDILLLTVAVLALAQGSRHRAPLILVSLGMCAMALSAGAFAYLTTIGSFASVSLVDLGSRGRAEAPAFYDRLTGNANRELFINRVRHALELHRRDQRPVSIAFVDLDGFKGINDTVGHAGGCEMLVRVAERLRGAVRPADTLARLGGDEFAVLMEHGHEPATVARSLVGSLHRPFHVHGRSLTMSASVGVASLGSDGVTLSADGLLGRADIATYAVKRSGRNDFRLFTSDLPLAEGDDLTLRQALLEALESRQVRAMFQPTWT